MSQASSGNRTKSVLRQIKRVTARPHCSDQVFFIPFIQRLAQTTNVHIHSAQLNVGTALPCVLQQFLAGENLPRMAHQKFEQPVFGWAKRQQATIAFNLVRYPIKHQRFKLQGFAGGGTRRKMAFTRANSVSMPKGLTR